MMLEVFGLVFCQVCWSDDLEGGLFVLYFYFEILEQLYVCSLSMLFIGCMYEFYKEVNNWEEFVVEVKGWFIIFFCF